MKVFPQEVFLHGNDKHTEYVYSVDVCSRFDDGITRLATGGADPTARIWYIDSSIALRIRSELFGHTKGVNCVRFSPIGDVVLASSSDDGQVLLWRLVPGESTVFGSDVSIESWVVFKKLNCLDEICHISWSPDGQNIACALQREMSIVFDAVSGRPIQRLDGHSGRVLGIAWDPLNECIATQSSDRSVRIYGRTKKKKNCFFAKALMKEAVGGSGLRLFMSDSHFTDDPTAHFFRRLEFSPDGSMLVTTGGLYVTPPSWPASQSTFACHLFSRVNFVSGCFPTASIPSMNSPVIAVRFHQRKLRKGDLDFFIFAIIGVSHVAFYTSADPRPFAYLSGIHCTCMVDGCWFVGGENCQIYFIVCSTDGYSTIVQFDREEIGEVF